VFSYVFVCSCACACVYVCVCTCVYVRACACVCEEYTQIKACAHTSAYMQISHIAPEVRDIHK